MHIVILALCHFYLLIFGYKCDMVQLRLSDVTAVFVNMAFRNEGTILIINLYMLKGYSAGRYPRP